MYRFMLSYLARWAVLVAAITVCSISLTCANITLCCHCRTMEQYFTSDCTGAEADELV